VDGRCAGAPISSHGPYDDASMGDHNPTPWSDAVVCGLCSRALIPLSFTPASMDDDAMGIANRPDLKCPGCGGSYRWQDSSGWVPSGKAEGITRPIVHEPTGHALRGHPKSVRGGSKKPTARRPDRRR